MSDTVKLIIEIPEPIYDRIKYLEPNADTLLDKLMRAIQNGIPLDDVRADIDQYLFQNEFGSEYRKEVSQILNNIGKAESEDKG